jgi:hypothetical protein
MQPRQPTISLATDFIVSKGDIKMSRDAGVFPTKYVAPPEPIERPMI